MTCVSDSPRPRPLDGSTACSRSIQNSAHQEGGPPYSKHFVHSKSSQYRRLQSEWKANVYLAQSRIQVQTLGKLLVTVKVTMCNVCDK